MFSMLASGALSLAQGFFANKSAKSTQKRAKAEKEASDARNRTAIDQVNITNNNLGKQLLKVPEITTTTGSITNRSVSSSRNSVDISGMMQAAEEAGFNPVTFLQNGGLQAYLRNDTESTDTQSFDDYQVKRTGHNAVAAFQLRSPQVYQETPAPTMHVPHMGEAFANAGAAAFNQYRADAVRADAQDFQRELMNTQLAAYAQRSNPGSASFYVPGFKTAGSYTTPTTQGGLSAVELPHGNAQQPEQGDAPKITNPNAPWWLMSKVDPTVPDVTAATDRRGESEVAEVGNYVGSWMNDFWYNTTGKTNYERYRDWGYPVLKGVKSFFGYSQFPPAPLGPQRPGRSN